MQPEVGLGIFSATKTLLSTINYSIDCRMSLISDRD